MPWLFGPEVGASAIVWNAPNHGSQRSQRSPVQSTGEPSVPWNKRNITIESGSIDSLFVPNFAVVPSERGHKVFVENDGIAREVIVQLGQRTPERVEILDGLEVGDRVIVTNLLRVRDGVEVEAAPYVTVASAPAPADSEGAAP